jgi:hypothetical protein
MPYTKIYAPTPKKILNFFLRHFYNITKCIKFMFFIYLNCLSIYVRTYMHVSNEIEERK